MTAEDFLKRDESGVYSEQDIAKMMIDFAKYHVEGALRMAYFNHHINLFNGHNEPIIELDEDSILNAYPLDNIK